MAFDEGLAERIRDVFQDRFDVSEKKMFGGIAWMLDGNMCCGIVDDMLMARVGPEQYNEALKDPFASEMDFTGRAMKGFVYVNPEGTESDQDLQHWVTRCEKFVSALPPK